MRRAEHPEDREHGISEMIRELLRGQKTIKSVRAPSGRGYWRTEITLTDGSRYRIEVEETHPPKDEEL